jgi:hypothetical protein
MMDENLLVLMYSLETWFIVMFGQDRPVIVGTLKSRSS